MNNFFENTQNHGFWNFHFRFLPRGKKAAVNYFLQLLFIWMEAHHNENWPEICKLLPRGRKNVVLYTVTI